MKPLLPLALLCVMAATAPVGNAFILGDRKLALFESAPPVPAPIKQTVFNRSPIRLILRLKSLQTEPATFLLSSQPAHGTARLVPQISKEWAEVEYTPPQDRSIKTDVFKFAVSNSKGTSSEAAVEILFQDIGPRLEIPRVLDFGSLRVGEFVQLPLPVVNTGDEVAAGTLAFAGEWTLAEPSHAYRIEPGGRAIFQIKLSPVSTGKLEGVLQFEGPQLQGTVLLQAKVAAWIGAAPDPLVLSAHNAEGPGTRSTELVICNETDEQEWVSLWSTPSLNHPYAVFAPPAKSVRIALKTQVLAPGEYNGKIVLSGSRGRERALLWRATALAPSLGGLENLQSVIIPGAGKKLRLWNEGGKPGEWLLSATEPFTITLPYKTAASSAEVKLKAGEALEIEVHSRARSAATLAGNLQVRARGTALVEGGSQRTVALITRNPLSILLTPEELAAESQGEPPLPSAPTAPFTDVPDVSRKPQAQNPERSKEAPHGRAQSPTAAQSGPLAIVPASARTRSPATGFAEADMKEIDRAFLPRAVLNGLKVTDITPRSAKLLLPQIQGLNPEDLSIQVRELELTEDGGTKITWKPLPAKATQLPDGRITIALKHLPPGTSCGIRLLGPTVGKGQRIVFHQGDIQTPGERPWWAPTWVWLAAGAGLFLAFTLRKGRRSKS